MNELPFCKNENELISEFSKLRKCRKDSKVKKERNYTLSKKDRQLIWQKTEGHCHVCGIGVDVSKFEADHVKSHSNAGNNTLENFLPACKTCNNYRWHYLPHEMQWILKLGVWSRTEIEKKSSAGIVLAKDFIAHEIRREKRRVKPR